MKTPMRVSAGGFDAGVVAPGPIVEKPVIPKREIRDDYMVLLCSLRRNTEKDSDEERELVRLVLERIEANKQADVLLEKLQRMASSKLAIEWEAAKEAVREQQEKIDKFREQTNELTVELNRRAEARAKAQAQFDVARRPRNSSVVMRRSARSTRPIFSCCSARKNSGS
jgi:hypothetical protein